MRAQEVVARAAGLDAAGTGQTNADHAADGSDIGRAQQPGSIHRLERKLLISGIDQRHHVGKRRARLHGDDQLVRLIGRHRVERRQIEQRVGRDRLADRPFGAMADDLERLFAGDRRAHRLLDVLGVSYFQGVHWTRLAFHRSDLGNSF